MPLPRGQRTGKKGIKMYAAIVLIGCTRVRLNQKKTSTNSGRQKNRSDNAYLDDYEYTNYSAIVSPSVPYAVRYPPSEP